MSVRLSGGPPRADQPLLAPDENVNWLPRSRLRAGGRGDRLLMGLAMLTAALLASAAGVAVWTRHADGPEAHLLTANKASERASDRAAPLAASPPAPVVRTVTPAPSAQARPQPAEPSPEAPRAPAAVEAQTEPPIIRTTPEGVPIVAMREPAPAPAPAPAPTPAPEAPVVEPVPPIPLSSSPPAQMASAPAFNAPAGRTDVPSAAPSSRPQPMAAGSAATPSPSQPAPEGAPSAIPATQSIASAPPEQSAAPAPQRSAAAPAPAGSKVAVYLDEFPDQKAAAAGLAEKAGAYGKLIGSAGKLTYSRRNGNSWRLRVSNLDPATAEALCAKLTGEGAPCSVGPN